MPDESGFGDSFLDREWVLERIGDEPVTTPRQPTLRFDGDGRFTGSTGVNRMFGGYQVADGHLVVTAPGTTLMAGPPEAMAIETAFVRALAAGGAITHDGERLSIGEGATLLVLRAAPPATIGVTVAYRERIAMPESAVLTVTLADISRADAAADVIARRVIDQPGNVPVDVQLSYDPARIEDRHTYSVRATIDVDGDLWWTSTDAHLVLSGGAPDHVDIPLTRVEH